MKMTTSAARLQDLMNYYNITRADLEARTGIGRSALSRYLSGEREPRQDKIAIIATAYDVDAGWLLGLDVPMKKKPSADAHVVASSDSAQVDALIEIFRKLDMKGQTHLLSYAYELEEKMDNKG